MRNLPCTLSFTFLIAMSFAIQADAQSSSGRRPIRSAEQTARASWQPTRSSNAPMPPESPEGSRVKVASRPASPIQRAAHADTEGVLPPPRQQPHPMSVVEMPVENYAPQPFESQPLEGQVMFDSVHGSSMSCDAMPAGVNCGCGSMSCGGGCGAEPSCGLGCDGCNACNACDKGAWRPCITFCVPQNGWVSLEYLGWWQDGMELPPLITTSNQADAGVLNRATTRTIYGGDDVLTDPFDGFRLRFGVWLDACRTWGIGAEYFSIGQESENFSAFGNGAAGTAVIARPFFNTVLNRQDSELISSPGIISGSGTVAVTSELEAWGVHLRQLRHCSQGRSSGLLFGGNEPYTARTEGLYGFRSLQLDESVQITEDLREIPAPNTEYDIIDRFDTRNQFNGVELGWYYERTRGYWSFDSLLRLAVGNTRQTVTIDGSTRINNVLQAPRGGLLTQQSNIGTYKFDEFSVIPELNLNLGYQLTDNLRLIGGYTFLYWSNVVRPGDQISLDLNTNQLPPPPAGALQGEARPIFKRDATDYWAQGLSVGAEFRW